MADLDPTQSYSYRGLRFARSAASRAGSLVLIPPRYAATRLIPDRIRGWVPNVLVSEGPDEAGAGGMSGMGESAGSAARAATAAAAEGIGAAGAQGAADAATYVLPTPITFLTSPYLLVSIALGFFLHRVHHLVPPRDAMSPTAAQRQGVRQRGLERVLSLPIQLGVRIPALLLVIRACVALALAIAVNQSWTNAAWLGQEAEVGVVTGLARSCARMLVWTTAWAGKGALGKLIGAANVESASAIEHSSLLWQTYVAVAVSLTCENFVRALADDLPSPSHMNLLSFAFLLHVNSYGTTGAGTSIKGSTQTYLYLLICLLEILTLQASYVFPAVCLAYSRQPIALQQRRRILTARSSRLAITAFYSFVGQAFAMRAWAKLFGFVQAGSAEDVEEVIAGPVWLNKLPEVVFEVVVGLSVGLRLVAALIRGEELSFDHVVGQPATAPSPDEDYAIALVKYTTHILSSTRLSGLAYELSPLEVLPLSISTTLESIGFIDPPPCDDPECPVHGAENREKERKRRDARSADPTGEVILRRNGEVAIFDRVGTNGGGTIKRRRVAGEAVERGFEREIGRVIVEPNRSELLRRFDYEDNIDEALDRDLEVEQDLLGGSRRIAWRRFWRVLFRVGFYVVYRALRAIKVGVAKLTGWGRDEGAMQEGWRVQVRSRSRSCTPAVQSEDDEDDEDYSPDESDDDGELSAMVMQDGTVDAREEMRSVHSDEAEDEVDSMMLFSDLSADASYSSTSAPTPQELAPYLLAHHLSGSSTPLTRRRYRALLDSSASPSPGPSNSLAALSSAISQRRNDIVESAPHGDVERWMEEKREEWRESRSRFCVVCTVEERTIVLWPCRCLCLCDTCRTTLSERSTIASLDDANVPGGTGGGKALCPTCRTPVQGFSRIFVP
ncbi:clathrin-coated vesicle protein [Rhodotorula toruloides]|uniref:Clathrin-coated vesicle protein n=1 Tax=Rhodotorula toruloides TaxID=5286 RepID=A0A511KPG5_RHOTO|nr:clathrin-coated vesicle protein [Rhodotorula toruloides]